jgi:hypothetical protein
MGAVYGSLLLIGKDGTVTGVNDLSLGGRHAYATVDYVLSRCCGLLGSNVVARREVVAKIGAWDESFPTSGDLDFGLRLAVATTVGIVAEPHVRLVETTVGSLSKNVNTGNRLRVLDKFERNHPELANAHAAILRRSRARILRTYAEDLLWNGRIAEAEQRLAASLHTRPTLRAAWLLLKAEVMRTTGVGRRPSSSTA